ncbi:MAG: D-glutamate cyclase family protein [Bryobacteraceae bacterium]
MSAWAHAHPRDFRQACREGRYSGTTRGVAMGYLQCNLVMIREPFAYDFLLYCQRNQQACPVIEVLDAGDPTPHLTAPGADLRTDLPRYAVYRDGRRLEDVTDASALWQKDFVSFLIGSGITFDQALQEAGISTDKDRWVLRTTLPTTPAGRFRGPMAVTMRWLTPQQAVRAVQVTSRYPFNHGAPIHIGDPAAIGADLANPLVGAAVERVRDGVVPVFWACGVTPQEAALAAAIDIMVTHAPAHGFVTDWEASRLAIP